MLPTWIAVIFSYVPRTSDFLFLKVSLASPNQEAGEITNPLLIFNRKKMNGSASTAAGALEMCELGTINLHKSAQPSSRLYKLGTIYLEDIGSDLDSFLTCFELK
jgi:hypothetical protein